jgi:uncharacterized protein YndB with AHSA1/START domain
MRPITVTTPIDAPRERVCEVLLDLATRPAFCDHFLDEFRLERLDPVGVGAAARFRVRETGWWMETAIVEADPPHRIVERGKGGRWDRIPAHTVWEVVEGPGPGGCEVTLSFWTEPTHPLDRLRERFGGERWLRRQWSRALERLKGLMEDERPLPRVAVGGGDRLPGLVS